MKLVRIIPGTVKWDRLKMQWRGRGTDRKYYYQVGIEYKIVEGDSSGIETCVDTPSQIAAVINARLKRQFQRSALGYLEKTSKMIGD